MLGLSKRGGRVLCVNNGGGWGSDWMQMIGKRINEIRAGELRRESLDT